MTRLFSSANYCADTHRGGGVSLTHLNSNGSVFFQPGDDAAQFIETIEALEELPETKRETIFDMVASNYF